MNYELAKKLKDAGFLQNIGNRLFDSVRLTLDEKEIGELCYIPTLSELIEACLLVGKSKGLEEFGLGFGNRYLEDGGIYRAVMDKEDFYVCLNNFADYEGYGSTPEEAIAKLWLELNKK